MEEETESRIRDSRRNLTDIELVQSESKAYSKYIADDDAKNLSPPAAAADEEIGND